MRSQKIGRDGFRQGESGFGRKETWGLVIGGLLVGGLFVWADWPNIKTRIDNPRATGSEVAVIGAGMFAASLMLDLADRRPKFLRGAGIITLAAGVGACTFLDNKGHLTPEQAKQQTTTPSSSGPKETGNQNNPATTAGTTGPKGTITYRLPGVVNTFEGGCKDLPPVTVSNTAPAEGDRFKNNTFYGIVANEQDWNDSQMAAVFDAKPDLESVKVFEGQLLDVQCPAA